jgi:hypothetical protein
MKNPGLLNYNCKTKQEMLTVTPNLIGFQSVMQGIAFRIQSPKASATIVVDQQSQFNKAQRSLAEFYANARNVPWLTGPGLPEMDLSKIPTAPIVFRSSKESIGLELVDCYLWMFKRVLERRPLAPELSPLIKYQLSRGRTDDISLSGIEKRWSQWFDELPEPTEQQRSVAKDLMAQDEARRLGAIGANAPPNSKR